MVTPMRGMRALRIALVAVPLTLGAARARSAVGATPGTKCPPGSVAVPAGTFAVGTTRMQAYEEDEQPRRVVTLTRPYCIDRTEVTVAQYAACVAAGACAERKPAFAGEAMPMTNVSWHDARAACAFRGGRLPSEVEWEHAARGNDDRLYPWGSWHPDCPYADLWGDMWGSCGAFGPSPVGSAPKGASPFGALDLAGNVLEWVDDLYDGRGWDAVEPVDPRRADPWAKRHGVRGGSWDYDVVHSLRVSDRGGYPSELRDATLGFRCAFDPKDP